MAELTPVLKKVLKDCGLDASSCWKHKQSGKWVVYHWACEVIAFKHNVTFEPPTVVCADAEKKVATILVVGHLGDRKEWSFGEAAPYNTQQNYPFAMAEKRAKDRVVLKLVGLHGEAYSEEESEAFKGGPGRDITDGVGSLPATAEVASYDLFNPWGEVEMTHGSAKEYLNDLFKRLESIGAWWPSNEHVVKSIGERAKASGEKELQTLAHNVYKFGRDAWRQSPDNPNNRQTPANEQTILDAG